MSIDTLRTNGGYRAATYNDIKATVHAGHTEHLQTERGVVAFRPYEGGGRRDKITGVERKGHWVMADFYPLGGREGHETVDFPRNDVELIAWAMERLNGSCDCTLEPNDCLDVWANQAEREAVVLAVLGDTAILEYEMPGRYSTVPTSALRIQRFIGDEPIGGYRSVSYNNVPKRWLRAIQAADMTNWLGMGQGSHTRIPFPTLNEA